MSLRHPGLGITWLLAILVMPAPGRAQSPRSWSGVTVGAFAGASRLTAQYNEPANPQYAVHPHLGGVGAGVLAGYQHHIGPITFGAEADVARGTADLDAGDRGGNRYSTIDMQWTAHLRPTLGYVSGRTRLFAATGLAAARITLDDVDSGYGVDRKTQIGWTIGGGVERGWRHLHARGEYLYDDYRTGHYTIASPPGPFFPAYAVDLGLRSHTVRAGITYRF